MGAPSRAEQGKPRSAWKRFRHGVETVLVVAATWWIPLVPWTVVRGFIGLLGTLAYLLLPEYRRVARANLDIAFGDSLPRARRRRIVRQSFITYANAAVSLFWFPRLRQETIGRYLEFDPESRKLIQRCHELNKGVIWFTFHYGNWELLCLAMGFSGLPVMMITEPLPNPALERMIQRRRALSGNLVIPPRFALIKLFRHLKKGGGAAFMLDYTARRNRGVWLRFFGQPVYDSNAAAELAARTGAALLCGIAHPMPGGKTRVTFHAPVGVETDIAGADLNALNQRCLDFAQEFIREHPEHYLWCLKRWKRRPSAEQGGLPFYSRYQPSHPASPAGNG